MNTLLKNDFLFLGARVFLGLLFVTISIDKIADPEAFAKSILNYRIIMGDPALFFATFLPWLELLSGLFLLLGIMIRGSSAVVTILMLVFIVAVASALMRGLDISCGCFTQSPTAEKIGWNKLTENFALFAVSIYLYFSNSNFLTLSSILGEKDRLN